VLLDELEVGLAVGDRLREGIRCKDVERHAFSGSDLMLCNMVSILFDSEDDIPSWQAA